MNKPSVEICEMVYGGTAIQCYQDADKCLTKATFYCEGQDCSGAFCNAHLKRCGDCGGYYCYSEGQQTCYETHQCHDSIAAQVTRTYSRRAHA